MANKIQESDFRQQVKSLVAQIPLGRVMTYGQLAALCGNARAARAVGGIAHFDNPDLPWQRVVSKTGGLASGYPGGRSGHKQVLEAEGVKASQDYRVDIQKLIWWPPLAHNLIVIVGVTASGKSELALELAKRYNGEIICADSWTVRKKVNIGTAKPSLADQAKVAHHLLNIVEPCQDFTAAVFKDLALKAIETIAKRGKLPIMVGGSGLYIDGVIYDFSFSVAGNRETRHALNDLSINSLLEQLSERAISLNNIDVRNKRRLIRLLETNGAQPTKQALRANTLVIGLKIDKDELRQRIIMRTRTMISNGLEQEVESLAASYGWECEALKGVGYREWHDYFNGSQSLEETERRIIKSTLDLAKRQQTWFKRSKSIHWVGTPVKMDKVVDLITTHLNK